MAPAPAGYTPAHITEQILAVPSAIEGERKQVSVLFCDIVASSALATELGPEEFHLMIDRFFRVAMAEVHRYEGTINQFLGDGFMALFGAPVAHEDHARRAVLTALGIATQAEVKIRIGINSGLVVVGTIGDDLRVDYTAFGDTTVLAARLQAAAAPGAVLLSQRTAGLVRGYFQLQEVTPVQVKERTVYPLRVTGLGTRTGRIASGDELIPFTGRDRELAELQRALEVAADGEGQVVGLAGDPGLGKSRLALEFRRLAEPHAGVLEARCLSYGASIAYLPLFELVRNACGIAADDAPELAGTKIERKIKALELDVSLAHYLRHAFSLPAGDPGLAALDPQAIRVHTFDALRHLLVAEAGQRPPLVVLVEDLHWIDQTSEDFLAELTGDLPSAPIMLLATYRPGYSPPLDRQIVHLPAGAAPTGTRSQRKDRYLHPARPGPGCDRGDRPARGRQPVLPRRTRPGQQGHGRRNRGRRHRGSQRAGDGPAGAGRQNRPAQRRPEGGDPAGRGTRTGVPTRPRRGSLGRRRLAGGAVPGAESSGVRSRAIRPP